MTETVLKNSSIYFYIYGYFSLQFIRRNCVHASKLYCPMLFNPVIPRPVGLSLFIKGLTQLEIDNSLNVNDRMLIRLTREEHLSMKDVDG